MAISRRTGGRSRLTIALLVLTSIALLTLDFRDAEVVQSARRVAATVFSVAIAILAAFAVSRFRFRGRTVFSTTVLSTQMFPGVLFLLPLFLIFVNINNSFGVQPIGTRLGLIITYLTFGLPFSI